MKNRKAKRNKVNRRISRARQRRASKEPLRRGFTETNQNI